MSRGSGHTRYDRRFPLGRTPTGVPLYTFRLLRTGNSSMTFNTTGQATILSNIGAGTANSQRVGDRIWLHSLTLTMELQCEAAMTAGTGVAARVIIFRWLPDSSVETPTIASVLAEYATYDVITPYAASQADRAKFDVLFDRTVNLVKGESSQMKTYVKTIRLASPIVFDQGSNAGVGHIYMGYIGSGTAVANTEVEGRSMAMLRFISTPQ